MEYRRLGNAGLKVSEIALGGWTTFGDSIADPAAARELITAAYDRGINFYDIADIYARGESERMMGEENVPAYMRDLPDVVAAIGGS